MNNLESNVFIQLGVSLLLGLLVGLQRERTDSAVAGIRTFPLIAVFGTLCAWLGERHGTWVIAAGLVALAALLVMANFARLKGGDFDPGITTEVAALLLFGIGASVVVGPMAVAVALGGTVAVLLQLKKPLHEFVAAIGETDMKAIMQFALVSLVILPVLPNEAYGPYAVLNPFKIWLFVVLIVGLSLCGYVIFKFVGNRAGTWLGGILGGVISSTATTVSYARRTAEAPGSAGTAALVIMIASTILYVRVLILIAMVASGSFLKMAPPLLAMLVSCIVIVGIGSRLAHNSTARMPPQGNPAELKPALLFGLLYAVILFGVAAAKDHFGSSGLYAVAVLAGLTDVDAITLSTSQLANGNQLGADSAWRAILIASMSNFVFKAGIVAVLGDRSLLRLIAILFGAAILAGAAILLLWPA